MIYYKMIYLFILMTIAPSLCQYSIETGLKPDVTFNEHNDRFDVTSLIRKQKRQYRYENPLDAQSEEYRRKGEKDNEIDDSWMDMFTTKKDRKKLRKTLMKSIQQKANEIANSLITRIRSMRRYNDDFAYHDDMNSGGGGVQDFEENLKSFDNVYKLRESLGSSRRLQNIVNKLHDHQTRRLDMNPENEILLHYALPVKLNIEGFLQAPLNDK